MAEDYSFWLDSYKVLSQIAEDKIKRLRLQKLKIK